MCIAQREKGHRHHHSCSKGTSLKTQDSWAALGLSYSQEMRLVADLSHGWLPGIGSTLWREAYASTAPSAQSGPP
jgi:hypothetical protein